MSRLIDTDKAIKELQEQMKTATNPFFAMFCDRCIEHLEKQPTAVTHCKDCKHWADKVAGCTEHVKLCTVGGYMVGENGYCVYGEQAIKENEDDGK